MAVSIDRVYQKVLALANKEQRGYITPQEFNLFAHQAQIEIFEQYFYDVNQWTRQHGNDSTYSDMLTNLQEKIDLFNAYKKNANVIDDYGNIDIDDIGDLHRIGSVIVKYSGEPTFVVAEPQTWKENLVYSNSPLTRYNKKRPVYLRHENSLGKKIMQIRPYPSKSIFNLNSNTYSYTDIAQVYYTRKPMPPNWGYVVVNDKALYNSTTSTNFELHPSEESELVYRILALAGVAIEKPQLVQTAAGLVTAQIQQEKQ
jgi:hypothetical protein|tara:strand:- start:1390 stop:2160 length:771 start_codon:yes stop_codon:yes gene_type:complete